MNYTYKYFHPKEKRDRSLAFFVSVMCYDLLSKVCNLNVSLVSVVTDLVVLLTVLECV